MTATTTGSGRRPGRRGGPDAYDDLQPALRRYAERYVDGADEAQLRDHLIRGFLPLVQNLAQRFRTPAHPVDDIEQAGVVGLIKAIDRYDPDAATGGVLGYLVPSIRGEMMRYLRDHTWAMRVPRDLKELSVAVKKATDTLTHRLGRAPRPTELAREIGVRVEEVVETLGALESYQATPLDVPLNEGGLSIAERMGEDDTDLDLVENRDDLRRAIAGLPERERTILLLRFYGEQTQTRIAEQVGVSQMHVSRLLTRTLSRLREQLDGEAAAELHEQA